MGRLVEESNLLGSEGKACGFQKLGFPNTKGQSNSCNDISPMNRKHKSEQKTSEGLTGLISGRYRPSRICPFPHPLTLTRRCRHNTTPRPRSILTWRAEGRSHLPGLVEGGGGGVPTSATGSPARAARIHPAPALGGSGPTPALSPRGGRGLARAKAPFALCPHFHLSGAA